MDKKAQDCWNPTCLLLPLNEESSANLDVALTNAASVRKSKMTESQAYSHACMMTLVMKRWSDLQECKKCSDVEKYCKEKAIVEDMCVIMKLMTNDMGCSLRDLFGKVNLRVDIEVIFNAVHYNKIDPLVQCLRSSEYMKHFVTTICDVMDRSLQKCNVKLSVVFQTMNTLLGGVLKTGLLCLPNIFGGVLFNAAGGMVGGVGHAAGGMVSGVGHAAGEIVKGAGHAASGIANGVLNAAVGMVGGAANAAGGMVGGAANAAVGMVGGAANAAVGMVGGAANAAGGIVKGVGGLLKG